MRDSITMSRRALCQMMTLLLCFGVFCCGSAAYADDYSVDDEGRRFRTGFDPASAVVLGAGVGTRRGLQSLAADGELRGEISYRAILEFGSGDDYIRWQLDHRFLRARVLPGEGAVDLDAALYEASYLRHDKIGYATLPGSGKRIPFDSDIGLYTAAGQVRIIPNADDEIDEIKVGVAQAGVTLDPWRAGADGMSLEFGLGVRYDVDLIIQHANEVFENHRVAPFTATSVRFRWQDGEGRTWLDTEAAVIPEWTSETGWQWRFLARLRAERVLFAINDQPFFAFLDARWDRYDDLDENAVDDFRVGSGLLLRWQIK